MKRTTARRLTASATALAVALTAAPAFAQDSASEDVITVTGSLIKRKSQLDLPSPLTTVGSEEIQAIGAKDIADITQTLTFSNGAENRPDAFTQNQTVGTSSINLRGLGLNSTLILLNGRRQVLTGATNDAGVQFTDTSSLVPLIAVERVEILKDGASATYGSDAVAGVVNFITVENFEGVRLTADYQQTTEDSDVNEYKIEGLFGAQGDRSSIIAAFSFFQREPLFTADRRLSQPINDTSSLGNPGTFIPLGGPAAGAFIADPDCEAGGGDLLTLAPPGTVPGFDFGLCRFDFGEYFNLIADESRINGYFNATYDLTDDIVAEMEFGYARNRADRGNSPSFPSLTSPVVPLDNPFLQANPVGLLGAPVIFFGRINGSGADPETDTQPTFTESDTWRMSTSLRSDTFGKNGYWEVAFTHAVNDFLVSTPDTVNDRLSLALNGYGGPNCGVTPTDLLNGTGTPGANGCEYYNPFGTSITDPAQANSDELLGWLLARSERNYKSDVSVFDALISSELFEMPGGAAAGALGFQYREQSLNASFDEITRADGFSFLFGDQNYFGDQDSYAIFGEVSLPFGFVELNAALRYEDYGGTIGDSIDPKIALIARPTDTLSLRASYTTAFRAPSVNQQVSSGTSLGQVVNPAVGSANFAAIRTIGNPDLEPEESEIINVGFSFRDETLFNIDVDYWRYDFENYIVRENAQAIIDADFDDDGAFNGGSVVLNDAGGIALVRSGFVNATSLETSGVDFTISKDLELGGGFLTPSFTGTYVITYDIDDPQAGSIDGVGNRNFNNIGTSTPELRFNAGLAYEQGPVNANFFARYISSYDDDQNAGAEIDSIVTYDARVSLLLGSIYDAEFVNAAQLTFGVINLTDEDPPFVATNGGFDSKIHDPRGRLIYVSLGFEF